ncbi:hypothetical protein H072_11033 [Dactylellina haptotyla CBS 200.50]|uniref:LysM domain-containing protein n=1 Tax=Dactylellina haptotyla (strain CBS 200.50) TaxID=1284197 RepID=S8BJT6_DACHA|nr:hypothetical protein H072_11033 [Dactylellina haptotyla CBS 200.50]
MHQYWLGFVALVGLELLTGCQAYVPSPKFLQGRQNSGLSGAPAEAEGCSKWFTPTASDTCKVIAVLNAISLDNLIDWNPSLMGGVCDELIKPGTPYCVQMPPPPPPPSTTTTKKDVPTPAVPNNGISTPSPIQAGMIKSCNKFHLVASGQSCQDIMAKYSVSILNLFNWNPAIGAQCTSMWAQTYLCIGIIGGTPTAPSTTAPPADGTPSPIGANTTKNCKKWAYIRAGDTCQAILNRNKDVKSTIQDLVRWNPSIRADCSGLIATYHLCLIGPAAPPTTTKPTPANPTPSPIQPGMTKNCKGWAYVKDGQTCQDILKRFPKIKLAQLVAWNPAIGKDCSTMWARTYICVSA